MVGNETTENKTLGFVKPLEVKQEDKLYKIG